jgi:hypothetical protein
MENVHSPLPGPFVFLFCLNPFIITFMLLLLPKDGPPLTPFSLPFSSS